MESSENDFEARKLIKQIKWCQNIKKKKEQQLDGPWLIE